MSLLQKQRFPKVDTSYNFAQLEEHVLRFWEELEIFKKSLAKPAPQGNFVFYEGPPTANALPHPGHVLTRVIKDCLPRFKTMQGYYVRRQAGWDTHGLPVELSVERELIETGEMKESGPEAIRAYGLEKFNQRCFQSVRRYEQEWVKLSNRIGFWLDYDNAYFTFTNKYIESVWWLLKQIYDRGLMYKGYKIQWYSTLVGTGLSSHEVAQNWQTVKDPSVWVRAHVPKGTQIGEHIANNNTYLLLWTTTPWTLLSNVALCVHPNYDYVVVEYHNETLDRREHLVLAEGLLAANGLEAEGVLAHVKGRELSGIPYDRLFSYAVPDIHRPTPDELNQSVIPPDGWQGSSQEYLLHHLAEERAKRGWHVYCDEYVTLEDGTGIVHIAPAFGEDDYRLGSREGLPVLNAMDSQGRALACVELAPGKWFKEVDPDVITDLKHRGLLFKSQKHEHNYPHCYRTDAPLMSYPLDSWFIRTTAVKDELIANNQEIMWQPEHVRDGRFGDWLNNVVDWSLSRDRFWGTPLPVWSCPACGRQECLGSYAELQEKCPEKFANVSDVYDQSQFNPHRPYIDEYKWACPCGGTLERERYIIDPWFDAGSMPFSQQHYPFENKEQVDGRLQFPGDFISEAVDQTRGWFYTLHVIATLAKQSVAYKRCLVLGHITDEKGRKMSKRLGNVVDPWQVINEYGADAFRWYFYSSGNLFSGARFGENGVLEALQRFIIPAWNIYSFFSIYANIDGFDPNMAPVPWERLTKLDRFARIKLNKLVRKVTTHLDKLELTEAARCFEDAIENFSNWYVRRSRRRFWQAELNDEKWAAYQTLYLVLTTCARLLAPFIPFIAEQLYQGLVRTCDPQAPESVHLASYPEFDPAIADDELEYAMDQVRRVVSLGHAARKERNLRVRQPLQRVTLIAGDPRVPQALQEHLGAILDELNVKELVWAEDEREYVSFEYKPDFKVLGPRFGKLSQTVANWIRDNAEEITRQLEAHRGQAELNWVECELAGALQRIDESCFEVHLQEKEGTVAQRDGQLLLVLETLITPELRSEGLAREVVNRVQAQRKQLDLDYTTHIAVRYTAPAELADAIAAYHEYIAHETLADVLEHVPAVDGNGEESTIYEMPFKFTAEPV